MTHLWKSLFSLFVISCSSHLLINSTFSPKHSAIDKQRVIYGFHKPLHLCPDNQNSENSFSVKVNKNANFQLFKVSYDIWNLISFKATPFLFRNSQFFFKKKETKATQRNARNAKSLVHCLTARTEGGYVVIPLPVKQIMIESRRKPVVAR